MLTVRCKGKRLWSNKEKKTIIVKNQRIVYEAKSILFFFFRNSRRKWKTKNELLYLATTERVLQHALPISKSHPIQNQCQRMKSLFQAQSKLVSRRLINN